MITFRTFTAFLCFTGNVWMLSSQILIPSPTMTTHGQIIRIDSFPSVYVDPRDILIWLPSDYDPQKKYSVIYMHDGQMLFDSLSTWNGQDWKADETMDSLSRQHLIRDAILVCIPNNGKYRWAEYLPQAILPQLPDSVRGTVMQLWMQGRILSDAYLRFIVFELKPFIDHQYSTIPYPAGTFLMGSSMGGIISLYGLCEYPHIFGGAACMSTHWPLDVPGLEDHMDTEVGSYFIAYLKNKLPSPAMHKVYFDFGTETLDQQYRPYQITVDQLMQARGYNEMNWVTQEFPGADHSERSWAQRMKVPVMFLFGK